MNANKELKIGIVGLGLIGGSLAKAFKNKLQINNIVAFNRNIEPLKMAYNENIVSKYTNTIDETFRDCNIIFICTPVDKITHYIEKLLPFINKDCILTDVGSTKYNICKEVSKIDNITFIGGHPMTGSEKTGYSETKDFLYENAYYILTPVSNVSVEKYNLLNNLLKSIGAITLMMSPKNHDHAVASISHVPHVVASALVNSIMQMDDEKKYMFNLAAGGFKDITRIASASPDIWNSICLENIEEIFTSLESFKEQINIFEENLKQRDVYAFFDTAKKFRDSFSENNKARYYKSYEFKIDVEDKPGIFATIATILSVNQINIKNMGIINSREFENGIMSISFENFDDYDKGKALLKNMNFTIYE